MTPKEKAKELVDKMYYIGRYDEKENYNLAMAWERAKQCAIIAVKEMLEEVKEHKYDDSSAIRIIYWFKVINEIEKL